AVLPRQRRKRRRPRRACERALERRLRCPALRLPRLREQQRATERGGHLPRRPRGATRPAWAVGSRRVAHPVPGRVARWRGSPVARARISSPRPPPPVDFYECPRRRPGPLSVHPALRRSGRLPEPAPYRRPQGSAPRPAWRGRRDGAARTRPRAVRGGEGVKGDAVLPGPRTQRHRGARRRGLRRRVRVLGREARPL
ncbi:MAG: Hydrolase, alpha/beta fold family, partial [uncultured Solirubrobacterales bacterium]